MIFKNTASQKAIYFAFDATTNVPKTGDAANITPYVSKDYGAVTAVTDTSATEMDATNAPGYYLVDLTQGETNAEVLLLSAKSSTANVKVIGAPAVIFPMPTTGVLSPTTLGRTLDVSAGGEAGVDWANVGSPTTVVGLSGTTVKTATDVETDTADIQARLPAALTSDGNIKADALRINSILPTMGASLTFPTSIASPTNITAGTITTVTNLTNAPTNGDLTATMKTSVTTAATAATPIAASVSGNVDGSVASVVGAVGSVTGAVGSVTGAVGSVTGAVGSVTGNVGGNVTGSIGSLAAQAKADVTTAASNRVQKNTALAGFTFFMRDSTNHLAATGLTITAKRSLDGAALGACANSATEISNGLYTIDLAAGDLNGNVVTLRFTATGADDLIITLVTQPT